MSQPNQATVHEGETSASSSPRWRGPPYDHLRVAKLSCDGYPAATKSSAPSESATSRSPSPSVTPSESSNYYAPSTSSWATSAGAGTEFVFSHDDETERCGIKWDEESPRMPVDRPSTPASRVARFVSRLPTRSPSRPSSLRNAVSARRESDLEIGGFDGQESDHDTSDSECETATKSDDETETDKEDNEWSGQNGNLESVVIAAVDGDLGLAAHLIPLLHRDLSLALKSKVESWQCTAAQSNDDDGSPEGSGDKTTSYIDTSPDQSPGISRKRRRTGSDGRGKKGVGGWDGEDDDDENENAGSGPPGGGGEPQRMLACPFHKRDSAKYGIQHGNSGTGKKHKYRACTGPGFKSIQRLKEHLKRVHSPVQCERCHEIFAGTDRAVCLTRLAEHRKMAASCELGDPSKKEGIDEAQWAALDKQNRKKNQEAHRVEKWFEIWDVLFPDADRPESPWHDVAVPILAQSSSSSRDSEYFADLFLSIMDHKLKQGDIDFSDPKNIREGVKSIAQLTFKTYVSLHGKLAPESSSSETRNQLSLTAGSSTHLSNPSTTASHQVSATTAGTSIASGHASPAGRPSSYTLNPSFAMHIPRTMTNQPRQYMTASPMARVSSGAEMAPPIQPTHAPLQASGMPAFGSMNPGDPSGGYYFSSYPIFPQAQGSWAAPANPVSFSAGHMAGMPQDFMGGANFFGEPQNFGAAPGEGA